MADPQTAQDPLDNLSFSTQLDGKPFIVDGATYQINHPDSFSLRDGGQIEIRRIQIWKYLNLAERTDEQERALEWLLLEYVDTVTDAPREVLERLAPSQRLQLATAFMSLRSGWRDSTEALQVLADALREAVEIPGSPSSPGSADSSAATPSAGGAPSQSA